MRDRNPAPADDTPRARQRLLADYAVVLNRYGVGSEPARRFEAAHGHDPCCNPAHLEPVTAQVNSLRGDGPGAKNAAKAACPHGHPYTPENTRITYGRRRCRICIRAAAAAKRRQTKS